GVAEGEPVGAAGFGEVVLPGAPAAGELARPAPETQPSGDPVGARLGVEQDLLVLGDPFPVRVGVVPHRPAGLERRDLDVEVGVEEQPPGLAGGGTVHTRSTNCPCSRGSRMTTPHRCRSSSVQSRSRRRWGWEVSVFPSLRTMPDARTISDISQPSKSSKKFWPV